MSDETADSQAGYFADNAVTEAGERLIAKALTGQEIVFTKLVIGDGYIPAAGKPEDMTAMVSPRMDVPITKCALNQEGGAVIGGRWTNADLLAGFWYRELGVFARDPDDGEILYSYGNSGGTARWVPPGNGSDLVEELIDVVTTVGHAANVTAVFGQRVNFDRIPEAQLDAWWGATLDPGFDPGGTGSVYGAAVTPMTDPEVDAMFEDEGGEA